MRPLAGAQQPVAEGLKLILFRLLNELEQPSTALVDGRCSGVCCGCPLHLLVAASFLHNKLSPLNLFVRNLFAQIQRVFPCICIIGVKRNGFPILRNFVGWFEPLLRGVAVVVALVWPFEVLFIHSGGTQRRIAKRRVVDD